MSQDFDSPLHVYTEIDNKIFALAREMAEDRVDTVHLVVGLCPGWFFTQYPSKDDPCLQTVGDVYLYSDDVKGRFTVAYVHGEDGLAEKFPEESVAFQAGYQAFYHGASSIEFRPMKELEGDDTEESLQHVVWRQLSNEIAAEIDREIMGDRASMASDGSIVVGREETEDGS